MKIPVVIIILISVHFVCLAQKLPSLIPFNDKGKWGYADTTGKLVIPAKFGRALPFRNGRAIVGNKKQDYLHDDQSSFDWTIIDKEGNKLLKETYQYIENSENDNFYLVKKDDLFGYLDQDLKSVIPCMFDYIHPFQGNLARVQLMGCYGLVDRKGSTIVPCHFHFIYPFREGLACFIPIIADPNVVASSNHGYIDESGKIVIVAQFEEAGSFCHGYAYVKKNKQYVRINRAGKVVSTHMYDRIENFVDEMAMVRKDGKFGFINPEGIEVVPCENNEAIPFSQGFASVKKDKEWHYINKNGKRAFAGNFDEAYPFSEFLAMVVKDKQCGFIDTTGKFISEYRWKDAGAFHDGMAYINITGRIGFINRKNQLIIKPIFADAGEFNDGICPIFLTHREVRKISSDLQDTSIRFFYVDKYGKQYFNPAK